MAELELAYAPPFSSAKDPVNMAGFVIGNLLDGTVRQFHWNDVPGVQHNPEVTLLDTRTPGEYRRGHIEGAVHIPLDELRARLEELDKGKPVYVHCPKRPAQLYRLPDTDGARFHMLQPIRRLPAV